MKKFFCLAYVVVSASLLVNFYITRNQDEKCPIYSLINKTACEDFVIDKAEYADLRMILSVYLENSKKEGIITDAGIYFRDLEDGPTMGINEYTEFVPASLLKIPLAMNILNIAEKDSSILKERLSFQGETANFGQHYKSEDSLKENEEYTIDDLVYRLLVYSDNVAAEILRTYLSNKFQGNDVFQETLIELGILPNTEDQNFTVSVKRYSALFRTLYKSSYLSPESSEKILQILTNSTFEDGLVSGVPNEILVAHKFGERTIPPAAEGLHETKQLHDCGIVYYPGNPYVLCVMTKGANFEGLENVIGDISKMVYEEVDSRRK